MDVLAAVAMSVSVKPNSAIICPGFTILFPAFRSLALGCQIRKQAVMTQPTKELPADNTDQVNKRLVAGREIVEIS